MTSTVMPSIEILAFILGGLLILVGVVGGGVEVKEIRIPKLTGMTRFLAVVVGFVVIGMYYEPKRDNQHQDESDSMQQASNPVQQASNPVQPLEQQISSVPPQQADVEQAEQRGRIIQILSGSWRIRWKIESVLHEAQLVMDGRDGIMRISLKDEQSLEGYSVDESMKVVFGDDESVYLVGSNPVISGTSSPDPNYVADIFRINSDGNQVHIMLCDMERRCGEVFFERV